MVVKIEGAIEAIMKTHFQYAHTHTVSGSHETADPEEVREGSQKSSPFAARAEREVGQQGGASDEAASEQQWRPTVQAGQRGKEQGEETFCGGGGGCGQAIKEKWQALGRGHS